VTDFDRRTVEDFRANGGQAGGVLAGTPLVLIHHIGARTGTEHVTPLAYSALDGDSIAIAASNGGSPKHPAWYHNLKANPAITVELGTQKFEATAEEQTGPARADLWTKLVAQFPDLATFAASTDRPIPLFLLRRQYRLWVTVLPLKAPGHNAVHKEKRHADGHGRTEYPRQTRPPTDGGTGDYPRDYHADG
jgi:deazaflavin-dependent oxidoreductase (nitroreductase family)